MLLARLDQVNRLRKVPRVHADMMPLAKVVFADGVKNTSDGDHGERIASFDDYAIQPGGSSDIAHPSGNSPVSIALRIAAICSSSESISNTSGPIAELPGKASLNSFASCIQGLNCLVMEYLRI